MFSSSSSHGCSFKSSDFSSSLNDEKLFECVDEKAIMFFQVAVVISNFEEIFNGSTWLLMFKICWQHCKSHWHCSKV
jgi:hypothetical protein